MPIFVNNLEDIRAFPKGFSGDEIRRNPFLKTIQKEAMAEVIGASYFIVIIESHNLLKSQGVK